MHYGEVKSGLNIIRKTKTTQNPEKIRQLLTLIGQILT